MKLNFYGAAGEVTGSKHLITLSSGKKVLLDCGFFQGRGSESAQRNRHFDFNPEEIDYLILSHAHIDHSGNIPLLVKNGFRGKIYATPATFDLCKIMLADSAHIQLYDVKFLNKRILLNRSTIRQMLNALSTSLSRFPISKTLRLTMKCLLNSPMRDTSSELPQ